jgi:hypothetical protein
MLFRWRCLWRMNPLTTADSQGAPPPASDRSPKQGALARPRVIPSLRPYVREAPYHLLMSVTVRNGPAMRAVTVFARLASECL